MCGVAAPSSSLVLPSGRVEAPRGSVTLEWCGDDQICPPRLFLRWERTERGARRGVGSSGGDSAGATDQKCDAFHAANGDGCDAGTLHALDAETGAQKWQYDTGGHAVRSPVVVDGQVAFGVTNEASGQGSGDNHLVVLEAP